MCNAINGDKFAKGHSSLNMQAGIKILLIYMLNMLDNI